MSRKRNHSVSRQNQQVLQKDQSQPQRLLVQQQRTEMYSGPIPHPDILQKFDVVSPGSADRIIAMAESEITHRHKLESIQVNSDIETNKAIHTIEASRIKGVFRSDATGQWLGAFVALVSLLLAAYTSTHGAHYSVSIALVSLPVLGMVKAIANGRDQKTPSDKATEKK